MIRRFLFALFFLSVVWVGCGSDDDDNGTTGSGTPTISGFMPAQISRGDQNRSGSITGTNLAGATMVSLGADIVVLEFASTSASEVSVRFRVPVNASPGARTVSVTTPTGSVSSDTVLSVSNNRAPTASFTASAPVGAVNTPITFDASQSSDPDGTGGLTYAWTFGDGSTGSGVRMQHTFATTGDFSVTLMVSDAISEASSTKSISVIEGVLPKAVFTTTPSSGSIGTEFRFDASSSTDDGRITGFVWDFGDGDQAEGKVTTHTFSKGGDYPVTLTVTDNTGLQSSMVKELNIESFNENAAREEINKLIYRFFRRYSELHRLAAEVIVDGWSTDRDCPARNREIEIIERQKKTIAQTTATITKSEIFFHADNNIASNEVKARFEWITKKDGKRHTGSAVHNFTLILEDGSWQVCRFTIEPDAATQSLFPAGFDGN